VQYSDLKEILEAKDFQKYEEFSLNNFIDNHSADVNGFFDCRKRIIETIIDLVVSNLYFISNYFPFLRCLGAHQLGANMHSSLKRIKLYLFALFAESNFVSVVAVNTIKACLAKNTKYPILFL